MADRTFDQLLDEQKKTTSSLNRLGKTLQQQLLGDETQEKDERRVAAGNKAWQTRQENLLIEGKTSDPKKLEKSSKPKSAEEEIEDDRNTAANKRFGKLGDIFRNQLKGLKDVLGKLGTGVKGGLAAGLAAVGLFALAKFLDSPTWKKMRLWLIKHGADWLDKTWAKMKEIWTKYLLPFSKWLGGKVLGFLEDLMRFIDKPSWENFVELVGDNKLVIAAIIAMFAPKGLITLALGAFKLAWGATATAIGLGTKVLTGLGALLGGGVGVGAVLVAGVATAAVALKRAKEAFDMERNEYEKTWYEALGTAAAVFYIELFKIPAEFLASFIPQEWKDKFFMSLTDFLAEDFPKWWGDTITMPVVDEIERIKARWVSDMEKLAGYWGGILNIVKSGWEKIARKLLGLEEEPPVPKMKGLTSEQLEAEKKAEADPTDYSMSAARVGVMVNEKSLEAIKNAGGIQFSRGVDYASIYGAVNEPTEQLEKFNEDVATYKLKVEEINKKNKMMLDTTNPASEAGAMKLWENTFGKWFKSAPEKPSSVNMQTNAPIVNHGNKNTFVTNTSLVDTNMTQFFARIHD